jgi:tetratricopeptide (TPR) repeat protein
LAPFALTQKERAREQVQQALALFVERQILLEDTMQVHQWGAAELEAAMALAKSGDADFIAESYDSALTAYQAAVEKMDAVISQGNELFSAYLDDTLRAIQALDPAAATVAIEQALTIKPNDAAALNARTRAQALPTIVSKLRSAKNHELGGRYSEALAVYDEVAQLDPLTSNLNELRAGAMAAQAGNDVASHISRGFAALQNKQFAGARNAFNAALRVDPDNAIAKGGLQQVAEVNDLTIISNFQSAAEQAIANEQWQDAIDAYQEVLKLDKNIQFAKRGLAQASAHQKAQRLLTRIVNEPQKLSTEKLFLDAREIVQDAQQLEFAGPELTRLSVEVNRLLALYADPVEVVLLSDNATNIVMSNVGQLGSFERRTLSLRPGAYTIRGSQNGCRDIFLNIEVLPGIEPLDLSCPESISQ